MGTSLPACVFPRLFAACMFFLALVPAIALAEEEPALTAASNRPLPEATDLLREVQKNQKNLESLVKNYTYTKKVTEQETDKVGNIKKETVEEFEVLFHGPHEINRLISKNRVPLNEAERKKEQEKVDKKIAELDKRDASGDKKLKEEVLTIDSFLRCSRFINGRRAAFRGKEMVVYDFEPAPRCDAQNRAEKALGKVGGVIWIDEDDKEVVRMEVRLIDGLSFGGFLASVQKGSQLIFEQQKINNEIWLPSSGEIHYGARLLFKGMHGNILFHYADYKKFRVDTTFTVVDGSTPPQPEQHNKP